MPKLCTKEDLEITRKKIINNGHKISKTIILCGGTGCNASGSKEVAEALKNELLLQEMDSTVRLRITGCHGFCEQGPIAVIEPGNILYCHITPDDAHDIVTKTIKNDDVIERLLYTLSLIHI